MTHLVLELGSSSPLLIHARAGSAYGLLVHAVEAGLALERALALLERQERVVI